MDGILILAHGSKRVETENIVNSLVDKLKKKTGESVIMPVYLQFSEPNLEMGIERLVKQGVNNVKIIPMFIFDGVHVTQDIPDELKVIREKHPEIKISMSRHIGDDDKLADILADRINSI